MGKAANPRRVADNEARAKLRMIRISPQKLNLIAQLIRGKKVERALADLEFSRKRHSADVKKVLESAIANAEESEADVSKLFVESTWVDAGPTIKRFQPKDRGRAHPIWKRTSHIHVQVAER